MSTFTDWNGPQGSGVRAMDLVQLANAYSELVTKLNQHLEQTAATNNVHQVKSYVDQVKADVIALIPNVTSFITQLAADGRYALKSEIPSVSGLATKAELNDYATKAALTEYLKKNDLSAQQVITDIEADIAAIQSVLDSDTFERPTLRATYVEGLIKAVEQIRFIDKHFSANVGGSDIDGVYYILGMLTDKAGTAYIKMGNTKAFSAVVNFAVTPGFKGALSVTTDCELAGLKWKIVAGTDAQHNEHAYLAIQSTEWISHFASSDGVGKFSSIEFDGAGINFIPVDSDGYKVPNSNCHDVCNCLSGKGFSFSELATVLFSTQIFREADNPYITAKDITALDIVGLISFWPEYDENGTAINVAEGYHACDGTPVLDTDDVSDEFRLKFTEYPLQDYSVIKTKSTVKVNPPDVDPAMQSLAEAVCTMHGIQFFTSISALPVPYKEGEPVIVQSGQHYSVYVYKEADGWKKYSTDYNDINKTIGAVAAVIAAEHGADVYTVYDSVSELPTGPSVETGALAIVFDGVAYTVFKYNGTAWEIDA